MTHPSPPASEFEAAAPPANLLLIVATTAAWSLSLLSYYAQPQLLGPIMSDFELGEEAVGWLFSLENAALALTILAAASPLARRSRAQMAIAGGLLACAANAASPFATSYEMLLVTRFLVGTGSGLIGAAGTASAASTRNPVRVFAIVQVTSSVIHNFEPSAIPFATVPFSSNGGFFLLAGASLAIAPLFIWLQPPRKAREAKLNLLSAPNRSLALVAMAALFTFEVGQGGVWTFVAQIGEHIGLDEHTVGRTMTVTGMAGLFGGVVAAWLGGRFGTTVPIAIGIGLNVLAACGIALSEDSNLYAFSLWLWTAAYTFAVPYLMGALASMDDLGRWVVASDGVWTLGDAVGPGVAGMLVERGGYLPLAGLSLVTGILCVFVMIGVVRRFEGKRRRALVRETTTPPS
jgi:predicted MFS family arabinose efflux permease